MRELIDAGCLHADVATVAAGGLRRLHARARGATAAGSRWRSAAGRRAATRRRLRRAAEPFSDDGRAEAARRQLRPRGHQGLVGARPTATSSRRRRCVFDTQEALLAAFEAGELERDFVAVVRFQGPRANGMPELHKLTPPLGVLQGQGFSVALVTDGRMSGASGKVPAAIHVSPEALAGGPLGQVRDGDVDPRRCRRRHARGAGRCRRVGARASRRRSTPRRPRRTATTSAASSSPACAATSSRAEEGACTWL